MSIIIAILLVNAWSLSFSPPPTDFEAWMVEPGCLFFQEGTITSYMFDNILETRNGCVGQGNLLHILFGIASKIGGYTVASSRTVTFVSGIVLILLLYRFSSHIGGKYAAFLSVFYLISTNAFFYSVHLSRASIFVGTLHLIAIFCLWRFCDEKDEIRKYYYAVASALAGFSTLMFHWSGIIVALSITVMFLFINRKRLFHRSVLLYGAGAITVILLWTTMHIVPLGLDLFLKKMHLAGSYLAWKRQHFITIPYHYFFVSKLNFLYFFSFLTAIWLIFITRDRLRFVVAYLMIYLVASLVMSREDPEPHKAIIFVPFLSVCVGVMLSKTKEFWKYKNAHSPIKMRIAIVSLVFFTSLAVGSGMFKQVVYIVRALHVDYEAYAADIKEVIPPQVGVLGQPHLWFSLNGRNKLLGGTYFMSRAYQQMRAFPKFRIDEGQPALTFGETKKIFDFLKTKNISYIVASEGLYYFLELNGFFRKEFKKEIVEIRKISTFFYGREIFQPGFVRIYKISDY